MKKDYLWNKTGENAEIERLENALKAFCYQEVALPSKIIPFERKTSRGFFRLSFALAAFAAILVICLGVWFQVLSGKIEPVNDLAETIIPPIDVEIMNSSDKNFEMPKQKSNAVVPTDSNAVVPTAVSDASRFRVKKVSVLKDVSAGRTHDGRQDACVTFSCSQQKSVKNIEAKKSPIKLTKEEKYAYDQLMLALSITSSKLKLVTDKIENVEEENAVREDER